MTDFVMVWDCSYCSRKGILGYVYDCPGCSHPRTRKVVFYDPPTPIIATSEQMVLMGGKNPNWYCLGCDSGNKQSNDECWNCGTPRGQAPDHTKRTYESGQERYTAESKAELEAVTPIVAFTRRPEKIDQYNPPVVPAVSYRISEEKYTTPRISTSERVGNFEGVLSNMDDSTKQNIQNIALGITVFSAISLFVWAIWFFMFNTHTVNSFVSGYSWTQSVSIEEYQTLHEQAWSIPAGGRKTNEEKRQNGTDKIHDGWETVSYTDTCTGSKYVSKTCYDDNGNGSKSSRECGGNESYTYSCQKTRQEEKYHFVPHYDQWYWYDIERWVEIDRRNSFGEDHEPYFDSISPVGEKQRRIESLGTYTVNFSCDEPGPFSKDYDLSDWKLFKQDVPYEIEVNPVHSIISYPIPIPAVLP